MSFRNGVGLAPKDLTQGIKRRYIQRNLSTRVLGGTAAISFGGLKKNAPGYSPSAVTKRLVSALGNNTVAALLGVSKDRPNRWASGQDAPNEENRALLADLDALVGHLHSAFTPAQAILWLEGHNAYLDARPVDVYRLEGAGPVIEAIRAHEQGTFA
ncbi:hypothetical protein IV500_05555 [Paeniglutamicibacter antarcticus]|uniref:Antitoxin Xre/MbcA/ParS-like toxin-binding domain-containing protein n=1 Tax=Arthrobacter terrae TaxID=2935737 RepID=A0A931CKZ7_9MICC|nr:hypothetical protein [Arthrobacter terrae]MBG0738887.1 hypothetical protein [Arthrobacter terrae]